MLLKPLLPYVLLTMAITLSSADYTHLWQMANPQLVCAALDQPYWEIQEAIPEQLGQGIIQHIQLRSMQLSLFNYRLYDDLYVVQWAEEEAATTYEFGFNVSGNRSGKRTGENFFHWGAVDVDKEKTWITYANDPVCKVDIHFESASDFIQLIADSVEELPPVVKQRLEAKDGSWFDDIAVITPAMRTTLDQILYCPFLGKTKQLYLEGKCLELIALKLHQLQSSVSGSTNLIPLHPDDIERIHAAQKILIDHLEDPPTLLELARQVNLNDYKLKVGFKQVFGTTVFGYLHQYRMEKARHLLHSRRLNVKEVAQAVGYANQSRFAAAFRKQFGVNPKAYGRG